jgi:hypothetical protein
VEHFSAFGTLNVFDEEGTAYVDPSEDLLLLLLEGLDDDNHFVVVERVSEEHRYAQAYRSSGDEWIVEFRDGSESQHFGSNATDVRSVHAFLTGWSLDLPGWRDHFEWTQVDLG